MTKRFNSFDDFKTWWMDTNYDYYAGKGYGWGEMLQNMAVSWQASLEESNYDTEDIIDSQTFFKEEAFDEDDTYAVVRDICRKHNAEVIFRIKVVEEKMPIDEFRANMPWFIEGYNEGEEAEAFQLYDEFKENSIV